MATPPTDQQLADIEARATAATPGPWGVYQFGGDSLIEIAAELEDTGTGYRARRTVARFDEEPMDNDPAHAEWTAEEDWAQVQADAAFVAAAREDVPALLAEVRRLRQQRAFLLDQLAKKDAASGAGDQALTGFLTAEQRAPYGDCGHDDYHAPHEWADRPGTWCPGHAVTSGSTTPTTAGETR
ncbi:hypothetical protein [Streptomyces sp. NPDC088789]|uniref:hypothetical protein n=1 Tax=Streptomyces sp. NPDC088789 TaxID=3365899 RepID=UPI00380345B7